MKSVILKDTIKEIKNTFKRFLSILLIVLLGVGFFAGIKATSPDMKKTLDQYCDEKNVMDIQVISTLGITDKDIETIQNLEEVENVVGSYSQDAIMTVNGEESVVKLETMTNDINQVVIVEGRLPEYTDECVVESRFLSWSGYNIGDTVEIIAEKIKDDEGKEKELLKTNQMKIVGIVESPIYISRERGSSKLGSGKIEYYLFIHPEATNVEIYTTAYVTVKGAKQLDCTKQQYEDSVEKVKNEIEAISEERKQERYYEIYDEAEKKIEEAENTLKEEEEKAKKEIADAEEKIENAKIEIQNGKSELAENRKKVDTEFANAEKQIKEEEEKLIVAEEKFNDAKEVALKEIENNKEKLESLKQTKTKYETAKKDLEEKQAELVKLKEKVDKLDTVLDAQKIEEINKKIDTLMQEIYVLNITITTIEDSLASQNVTIEQLSNIISTMEKEIKNAETELTNQENQLKTARKELQKARATLKEGKESTYRKLNNVENTLKDAEQEIEEQEEKLNDAKKEAEEKISEAEEKLEKAKIDLNEIKKPEWYILDRQQNTGYASYVQDTDRIANIATVFPLVFFVVAALISLTSMTRMVEEERVQIGTLKALGYTKTKIASKYIIYAILATIIGAGIGLAIGFNILPAIIANMYGMMYTLPEVILEFNIKYALMGTGAAVACTVGATIYSCMIELRQPPASLMRPKAPKVGKRVFLEHITFIWTKFRFTQKVTARNIFRYKKRFLMTIIGVMGCTALILAGFGLRDSISHMIPAQYGEIFKYKIQVSLKDDITTREINQKAEELENIEEFTGILQVNMQSVEITNIENTQNIQLIVPENTEELSKYICLQSRKDRDNTYKLDEQGIIITEKLSNLLNLKVGDNIKLKNADEVEVDIKISNITENYLMHYIYMSPKLYEELYQEKAKTNTFLVNTIELSEDEENKIGKKILEDQNCISGVNFVSSSQNMFSEVMENMNFVVWVLIVSAGLLAFVVLYNLSNTNISERIRELATIKVLGFYDKEVYDYISKEMNILTMIGMLVGLFAGVFLTMFIIKTCELDIFMFDQRISNLSYIYAIAITILFATIVNITTYFALKKINMIESLKSVE